MPRTPNCHPERSRGTFSDGPSSKLNMFCQKPLFCLTSPPEQRRSGMHRVLRPSKD